MTQRQNKSRYTKYIIFFTVILLLFLTVGTTVTSAAKYNYPTPNFNINTARLKESFTGGFLKWYEVQSWKEVDGIKKPQFNPAYNFQRRAVDFLLFFGIFATIVYIAFHKLLTDLNKGAKLGLALFLGIALALSVTIMLKNPITELFYPFAVHIIYLIVAALFFWFFKSVVFQNNGSWVWPLLLALLLTWLAFGTLGIKVNCPDWICGEATSGDPTNPVDTIVDPINGGNDNGDITEGNPDIPKGTPIEKCKEQHPGWSCEDKPNLETIFCPDSAIDSDESLCNNGKSCMSITDCDPVCGTGSTVGYQCQNNIANYNCADTDNNYYCAVGICAKDCVKKPPVVKPPVTPPTASCDGAQSLLNKLKLGDDVFNKGICNTFVSNYGKRNGACAGKGYDDSSMKAVYNMNCARLTNTRL